MPTAKIREISDDVYISLVDSLFKEGRSLFLGASLAFLGMFASYWKTGATVFLVCSAFFFLASAFRIFGMLHYQRVAAGRLDRLRAEKWEMFYVIGATISVATVGIWCFLAFGVTNEPFVQLISFSMTIGYTMGVFGRNFGNSKFASIQTFCAWLPMTAGLLIFGDSYHWFFAALLAPLFLAVKFLADRIRSVLLEAIEERAKAEAALLSAEAEARKAREARARVLELVARLRQSKRSEEAAIATRDQHMQFLATMSHEIRTPLNGIVGALELMSTSRAEKVPTLLETATASADALLDLVSEILDLAKLDDRERGDVSVPIHIPDLVEKVRLALEPIARSKKLPLVVTVDEEVPRCLLGDPGKVRQVLINLVGNALKFTDSGSVSLAVRLSSQTDRCASVEFEVRDTGIGIEAGELDQIYGAFYSGLQYDRDIQSSGLGLAIVKKAVASMNGTIECKSEIGVGTSFKINLVLIVDDDIIEETEVLSSAVDGASTVPAHILLVEDNDTNAMIVQDMLEDTRYSVQRVACGSDAVQAAAEQDFDVILMDISMPGMDGVTACHRIRDVRSGDAKASIIALTANAVVGDRERFLSNGFDAYLSKPIRRAVLVKAIEDALTGGSVEGDGVSGHPAMWEDADESALDSTELAAFISGRTADRACHLLAVFEEEMSKHRANIEAAYSSGEIDQLEHGMHSIVGMAGSVGAMRLSAMARTSEADCRHGAMPPEEMMARLYEEMAEVMRESSKLRRELSKKAA